MSKNGEVYVVYGSDYVKGVYANDKLAKKEKGATELIKAFDVEGYKGDDWEIRIMDYCKYYKPHLETIRELISCLYQLEGCCCGGLAHIVTDDNNIEDHHIQSVLEYCDEEQNKDRTERGLVKLICEELLKLSIQERVLLFMSYYAYGICNQDCKNCTIHKGVFSYE